MNYIDRILQGFIVASAFNNLKYRKRISIERLAAMHVAYNARLCEFNHFGEHGEYAKECYNYFYKNANRLKEMDQFIFCTTFEATLLLNKDKIQLYQDTPAEACIRRI
jgi:hypothetical protein